MTMNALEKWAVAVLLCKKQPDGSIALAVRLGIYDASSGEEAAGRAAESAIEENQGHSINAVARLQISQTSESDAGGN